MEMTFTLSRDLVKKLIDEHVGKVFYASRDVEKLIVFTDDNGADVSFTIPDEKEN